MIDNLLELGPVGQRLNVVLSTPYKMMTRIGWICISGSISRFHGSCFMVCNK